MLLKKHFLGTKYKCNAIQAHMVIFPFVKYCKIWALRDPPYNIGLDGDCVKLGYKVSKKKSQELYTACIKTIHKLGALKALI